MKRTTLCLIGLLSCRIGWSVAPDQPLAQMNHRVWTAANGAPSALIESIAQTTDGTLWLGTDFGLYRFDGVQFVRYASPDAPALGASSIDVVAAAQDGGLWVGFRFGGIALVRGGQAINYGAREGLPDGSVWKIVTDPSGIVWAAITRGLFSLRHGHWEETRSDSGKSLTPLGLAVDSAGTLWVTTRDGMLARPLGESRFRTMATFAHPNDQQNRMASAPDGSMWVFTSSDGLLRIDAPNSRPIGPRSFSAGRPTALFFDSHANLWFGSTPLRRMRPDTWKGVSETEKTASGMRPLPEDEELMLDTQGSGVADEFLEDREGNVWIASPTALHCFSHSNILVVRLPEDLIANALVAGADGEVWVAARPYASAGALPGDAGALIEIRNAAIVSRRLAPATGVFSGEVWDSDGSLWLGGPGGLTHMDDGQFHTTPLTEEARGGFTVQALVHDRNGAMWVSVVGRGLFRWADGQWTAYGGLAALPRTAPITEVVDADGALWLGYTRARIARVDGAQVRLFDVSDGLDVGNVAALYASGTQLWAGGEFGLERFDGRRFVSLRASGNPFAGLTGIVVTTAGELWTNGGQGIVRVAAAEVARAIADPAYRVPYATFDRLDGVPGTASPLRPTPSAIEASDGRLWFSVHGQMDALVSIDPQRIRRNPVPPLVKIWTVRAGNMTYGASGVSSALRLPARTTSLEVDYTAASFTIPERVRFRYRLEGFDRAWQDVADRRQAFYTNLGPGSYIFRVIAANEDDVWNNEGASLAITIQPAFYQTRWFYSLCALTGLVILWALYWARIRQVRSQVRGRLEERLIERERIARDLHDTLLQGVQGLILRFQVATDRIPRGEAARGLMERALERADQVLEESRSRVKELRVPLGGGGELSKTLEETAHGLSAAHSVPFLVAVEGLPRPLHPIVREEAYLIATEAIANAFRHARATKIEIALAYGDAAFTVTVRDDGQGIDGGVLSAGGKPEHWGLLGMRERARRIRGQLTIQSASGRGTEVQLRLPAEMAYQQRNGTPRASWWRKLLRGGRAVTPLV